MSVTIPIGPQHPALKEPISLQVTLDGEQVSSVDLRLSYNHRGVEKLAESKNFTQNLYLMERICGICSHSHANCYAQAVEKLAGVEITKRALYIRALVSELERVHSHLLWLGVAGHEVGFDSFFMYTWRDREHVMDLLENITGNRVHYAINAIGGVRRDVDGIQKNKIISGLKVLRERTTYYTNLGTSEPSFVGRIAGVGKLTQQQALDLCAVGPLLRCTGVARDVRKEDPYNAYDEMPFDICTADSGDILGLVIVRIKELVQSYRIIDFIINNLPAGELMVKVPRKIKPAEAVSRYEAPRGENIHIVRSNGTDMPERLKVRAPTLANYPATEVMLRNCFVADIPIIFASIDPCICCAERMVELVDPKKGKTATLHMAQLKQWPREPGKSIKDIEWKL